MAKTWGKEIWDKKSKNQSGLVVSGGIVTLILGKRNYFENMKRIQNRASNFLKRHKEIKSILEVGPGPDVINAKFFLKKGYELDLLDCSPNTLRIAKEKLSGENVGFFEQDMTELDLPKKYDMIFCHGTFLHCPQHLSMVAMNNFHNHLKKGGYLLIDFPIKHKMTLGRGLWEGLYSLGHRIKTKITGKNFYVTCGEYTLEELEDIFKRTNFKLICGSPLWILQKL